MFSELEDASGTGVWSSGQPSAVAVLTKVNKENWELFEELLGLVNASEGVMIFTSLKELEEARRDGDGLSFADGKGLFENEQSDMFRGALFTVL